MFIEHGRDFSSNAMENLYEGYGHLNAYGPVLCTTEIGLQCLTNLRKDERDRNLVERKIVLKPKILLESVLQFLDEDEEDGDEE